MVEKVVEEEMVVAPDMVCPLQTHKEDYYQQNCHRHNFIHQALQQLPYTLFIYEARKVYLIGVKREKEPFVGTDPDKLLLERSLKPTSNK